MAVRRVLVSLCLGVLVVVPAALTVADDPASPARCAGGAAPELVLPGACAHVDEAPPGVDPTEPVSTTELRGREGGTEGAYDAAQELGVPAAESVAVASPAVTCDGDGTSGYRVQAMYVVEAGRTNRFAALQSSFQLWAAGVDDVVNRSAALTGGVRHVRFVTDPSGGSCVARVLNVTVPAGATSSFNATISAVQALGYTDPARKYLMWTDATVLCGIASMYTSDGDTQANPNNGSYAQYARVDSGCWGLGDGAAEHSVEAHEVLHTLGGVQNSAPHSTKAGHCWDESDTMCYADGGGFAMKQVCPAEREYLYDCANDDYFSTYPDPGSYLDSHWNAADSRFLIGGGDGSGGGTPGAPTVLGATIGVNNPAVPGLPTQASVAPSVPEGRTVTAVRWKAARADCTFSAPTELQTDVTCAATATGSTTVTVTLTDSTGATKAVTSPLSFATGTARPVTLALGAAGQSPASGGTARVCTSTPFALTARVVDAASGQPVKGLAAGVTKQTGAMTSPSSAGSPLTGVDGVATLSQTATVATTYHATTKPSAVYAVAPATSLVAAPERCASSLSASADRTEVYYGDPVQVTGELTLSASGTTVSAAGLAVAVKLTTPAAKVLSLGTVKAGADGTFSLAVKPTATGTISASLTGTTGVSAATATAGPVTVVVPETRITGAVDGTDVGYGSTIQVTGTLERVAGSDVTPLGGRAVAVYVTAPGKAAVKAGGATTSPSGTFTASVPLKATGTLSVAYAGTAGQPAARTDVGPVVAGTWTTAVTATASAGSVVAGTSVTFTGTVSRTYQGATGPAPTVRVSAYYQPTGASTAALAGSSTTKADGSYALRVTPKGSGTWTVKVLPVAGYAGSEAAPLAVTVR